MTCMNILELRQRVFVVEQNCPYIDADGVDLSSWHVVGRDEHAALVAYARIIPPGVKYTEPAIGRVVTHPKVRGQGVGVCSCARRSCTRQFVSRRTDPDRAQMHLVRFYSGFGFEPVGDPYDEDGIPHVEMVRPILPASL